MPAADSNKKENIEFKKCADGTLDVDAALAAAKEKQQKGGKGKNKKKNNKNGAQKDEQEKKVKSVDELPGGTTGNKKLDALFEKIFVLVTSIYFKF